MKKLPLNNASFRFLENSFKEWLDIQGFAATTVYNLPIQARELLHYLESQDINHIRQLDIKHIHAHYKKLKERTHQRRSGGLSSAHLNKHGQALRKFIDYLRKVGRIQLPALQLGHEAEHHTIDFLTVAEINQLFATTYLPISPKSRINIGQQEAFQSRDRAMLAIYYGCGLRRNEGVHLNLSDINFDKGILHIRKGKSHKERFVPLSTTSKNHLQTYIYDHRGQLARSNTVDALFLNQRGLRMQGQGLLLRLKRLQQQTGDLNLLEKEIGLHTLRHSIATHLMAAGMKLASISKFLGHSSLESTQIYTHLAGLQESTPQPYANIPGYETTQLHEDEK